jgi:hypothetical protein
VVVCQPFHSAAVLAQSDDTFAMYAGIRATIMRPCRLTQKDFSCSITVKERKLLAGAYKIQPSRDGSRLSLIGCLSILLAHLMARLPSATSLLIGEHIEGI